MRWRIFSFFFLHGDNYPFPGKAGFVVQNIANYFISCHLDCRQIIKLSFRGALAPFWKKLETIFPFSFLFFKIHVPLSSGIVEAIIHRIDVFLPIPSIQMD